MESRDTIVTYAEDVREPLDGRRERTFHEGWRDAIGSGPYGEGTFDRLSW